MRLTFPSLTPATKVNNEIYLDYAATTPVDPEVLETMLPYFSDKFGNASSSTHSFGWRSKEAVANSRNIIASHIGAEPSEIIFTSGATESINIALKGVYESYKTVGNHIITCETEHKACLDTLAYLESKGARITFLPVDKNGHVSLEELKNAICDDTILVSIMWVNNETGVIQNVKDIGAIAYEHKVLFMSDASQALGKVPVDVKSNHLSIMPISAHKIYGPKGIGALYISRRGPRANVAPFTHGGSQEKGIRSGTLNTPGIVGFGKAVSLLGKQDEADRIKSFSKKIINFFTHNNAIVNGKKASPYILNIQLDKTKAVNLLKTNKSFCFSLGSACSSENLKPSHVLKSMGLKDDAISRSFRISIGRMTSEKEVAYLLENFKVDS